MPRATLKVCSVSGCPRIQAEARCPEHRREQERHYKQTTPTKATRTHAERMRRKTAVDTHRATHGEWCPGYKRDPHGLTAADGGLTADHLLPASHGGADGPLRVICRACNSSRGDRV